MASGFESLLYAFCRNNSLSRGKRKKISRYRQSVAQAYPIKQALPRSFQTLSPVFNNVARPKMAKSFKIVFVIFVFLVFLLYSFKLDFVPVHLNQDEMMFALNALGIAETGADYYGNKWPFYFWHLGSFWATPIIVYLTAVFLKFLPFSEATIRLSSAFLGTLNVALLMYLTHLIFRKNLLTLLAGILIAFTPVHFIHSRLLLDNLYTVPFVLLWLIFLKRENYFLAGLSLGVGFHSYHAAKIVMPLYFLLSVIYVYFVKQLKIKN